MPDKDRYLKYFDEAWKKVIERLFPQLIGFFIPKLHSDVDFSKGISFLDKEMERLSKRGKKGAKYVDKLAQVYLKNGEEQWILIHIEVQGYADKYFPERMFRYFYRIFDRYGKRIVSVAVLTGSETGPSEGKYELQAYGSGVLFRYLSFRLMDYDRSKLEKDDNPIALVVLTSREKELARKKGEKLNAKRRLVRRLYERGYKSDEIVALFEFIDWALALGDEEEKLFWEEVEEIKEVRRMPYVTSIERIGMKKGLRQGSREMVLEALDERFGELPPEIILAVNKMEDEEKLKRSLRRAIRCASLEEFKQWLDEES